MDTTSRQFVECTFDKQPLPGSRTYCYHWDGNPPLTEGEVVQVAHRSGTVVHVTVVAIVDQPPFATKSVIDRAPAEVDATEPA